jgi:UDP-3-O-[3-hydroxymyristoyl] glucosamine N-acyltransferase
MTASVFPCSLNELATVVGGKVYGDAETIVRQLMPLHQRTTHDVSILAAESFLPLLWATHTPVIVAEKFMATLMEGGYSAPFLVVQDAYEAMMKICSIVETSQRAEGMSSIGTFTASASAVVHPTAVIHAGCSIGANCVVGEGSVLMPNVVLYHNVVVGANTTIHANVVCYNNTVIGNNCCIHAGAIIGSDGFGYREQSDKSYKKIPHIGNVVLGNDVEIGANCTIDRAALGSTIIADGVKLDNLVHIAHGVEVGNHTAIAAQTGVSGGTTIGKRNRIAGQVGIVGHITIADDVVIYAQSGVAKEITAAGSYFGAPAKPARLAMRIEAALVRLPELINTIHKIQRTLPSNLSDE